MRVYKSPLPPFFKGGFFLKQKDPGQPSERYKKPEDPYFLKAAGMIGQIGQNRL
jgi:hypothetical protein